MFDLSISSLIGIGIIGLMVVMVVMLYYYIDSRLAKRMIHVALYFLLSIGMAGSYMWAILKIDSVWTTLLFAFIMSIAVSSLLLRKSRLWQKSFVIPVVASTFIGMIVVSSILLLFFPSSPTLFSIAGMTIEATVILNCVSPALSTYIQSLCHTQDHYQYLLANGATHFEATLPSVRRSLRAFILPVLRWMTTPLVVAPPMLFCGMVMTGCHPLQTVITIVLTTFLLIASGLLSLVALLYFLDRIIFDRSGRLLL